MNSLRQSLAIAALTVAVGSSFQARAGILLKVTDGALTRTANDLATPGFAQFDEAIGNFTVSSDAGVGFPVIGSPRDPVLDLTSLDVTTGKAGGTLEVALTETGFMTVSAGNQFISSIRGNYYLNSTATMITYLDTTNTAFGTGTPLSSALIDNQTGSASAPIFTGPYSLTEIVTITAGAGSLTSLDALVVDASEPASLPLLGAALAALALLRRRLARANRRQMFAPG